MTMNVMKFADYKKLSTKIYIDQSLIQMAKSDDNFELVEFEHKQLFDKEDEYRWLHCYLSKRKSLVKKKKTFGKSQQFKLIIDDDKIKKHRGTNQYVFVVKKWRVSEH